MSNTRKNLTKAGAPLRPRVLSPERVALAVMVLVVAACAAAPEAPRSASTGQCQTTAGRLFAMSKDRIDHAPDVAAPVADCMGEGGYCMAVGNMSVATTTTCILSGDMAPGVGFPDHARDRWCRERIGVLFEAVDKINRRVCAGLCGRGQGGPG